MFWLLFLCDCCCCFGAKNTRTIAQNKICHAHARFGCVLNYNTILRSFLPSSSSHFFSTFGWHCAIILLTSPSLSSFLPEKNIAAMPAPLIRINVVRYFFLESSFSQKETKTCTTWNMICKILICTTFCRCFLRYRLMIAIVSHCIHQTRVTVCLCVGV